MNQGRLDGWPKDHRIAWLLLCATTSTLACDTAPPEPRPESTATTARGIWSGRATQGHAEVVFIQGEVGAGAGPTGTGTFVGRTRCVLTAAHVNHPIAEVRLDAADAVDHRAPWARVLRQVTHPSTADDGTSGFDLRVMWTAPAGTAADTDDPTLVRVGLTGQTLGHQFAEMTHREYTPARIDTSRLRRREGVREGERVTFVGYGNTDARRLGTRHLATGTVDDYRNPDLSEADDNLYQLLGDPIAPGSAHRFNACGTDSGGPIFRGLFGREVSGVAFSGSNVEVSPTAPFGCQERDFSAYTALHHPTTVEFLEESLAHFCSPKFKVTLAVEGASPTGLVRATVMPELWRPDGPPLGTSALLCPGQCEASGLAAGRIELVAEDPAGPPELAFREWTDAGLREGECPCKGSRSPVCSFQLEEGKFEEELGGYRCTAAFGPSLEGVWLSTDDRVTRLFVRRGADGRFVGSYRGSSAHATLKGCTAGGFDPASSTWSGDLEISEGTTDPATDFVFAHGTFAFRLTRGATPEQDTLVGALPGEAPGTGFEARNNLPLGGPSCLRRTDPAHFVRVAEPLGGQTECPSLRERIGCF